MCKFKVLFVWILCLAFCVVFWYFSVQWIIGLMDFALTKTGSAISTL